MGEQGEGHGNGPKPGGGNAKGQSRAKYKTLLREKGEQGMAGQTRPGAGQGMTGQGKARQDSLDQGRAGQGRGITGARAGARQDRAGQGREGKGSGSGRQDIAGQCKAYCSRHYRTQRTAGERKRHGGLQDRVEGRAERTTGQERGQGTAVGEEWCGARQTSAKQGRHGNAVCLFVCFFFRDAATKNPAGLCPSRRGLRPKMGRSHCIKISHACRCCCEIFM